MIKRILWTLLACCVSAILATSAFAKYTESSQQNSVFVADHSAVKSSPFSDVGAAIAQATDTQDIPSKIKLKNDNGQVIELGIKDDGSFYISSCLLYDIFVIDPEGYSNQGGYPFDDPDNDCPIDN